MASTRVRQVVRSFWRMETAWASSRAVRASASRTEVGRDDGSSEVAEADVSDAATAR